MIDFLTAVFTDPLTLGVLATFGVFALFETVRPGRRFPPMRAWRIQGVVLLVSAIALTSAVPLVWDDWFAAHRLFDATGLGHVGGAFAGFGILSLAIYVWHRLLHRIPFLWRHLHQTHHSAERIDVFGAFLFHPLDLIGLSLVTSVSLVLVVGLTAPAAVAASLGATFCTMFQHANIRTPRWLGFVIQRPESHGVHHQRGVHAYNYGDIPIWDMLFGTFRNPREFDGEVGFHDGASRRFGALLVGKDIAEEGREASAEGPADAREPARMAG